MKMDGFSHVDTWLFDMDNTLYDANAHVFIEMKRLMMQYMSDNLGLSPSEAMVLRDRLWHLHGSTLRGLMNEYDIDPNHFLAATHCIDVQPVPPCGVTVEKIVKLPGRKIVYTNSTRPFAEKIVARLGLERIMDGVHAIEDADFLPKPMAESYAGILSRFDINPEKACFFEDSEQNLKPARALGMTTVWICGGGEESAALGHVQHRATSLKEWLECYTA